MENSRFGLRCCCNRYHHLDNCASKRTPTVIPVSTRLHREAEDRVAELLLWKRSSLIPLTASRSLSICLFSSPPLLCHSCSLPFSVPVSLPLHPHCVLADCRMKRSWCQSLSWGSGSCQHHSAVLLSAVEGGAWCFKGTVYRTVPPVFSSLLASTLSRCLSSLCHSSIKGVIAFLSHDEVFLCCQTSSLCGRDA